MAAMIRNFLRGCLVIVPAAVTIYVVYSLLVAVDGVLDLSVPGLGFVITIAVITFIGALASNVVFARILAAAESLLLTVPLVKLVYTSLRDLVNAFVGDKKRFEHPVVVSLAHGAKLFGFITREDMTELGLPGHVAVYMPQAYALAGLLVAFPRDQVQPVDVEPARFMALIVSGGVASTHSPTST